MQLVPVFDTNILFSATAWRGKPFQCVECAVVAGATHIVTGDRRHLLPLDGYRGTRIVTAAEFLAAVAANAP